jgi:hypothetical protein
MLTFPTASSSFPRESLRTLVSNYEIMRYMECVLRRQAAQALQPADLKIH